MTEDTAQEDLDDHLKSSTLTHNSVNNLFNNAKISKQKLPPIQVEMRDGMMGQTH